MYQSFQNGDFTESRFYERLFSLVNLDELAKVINRHTGYVMLSQDDIEDIFTHTGVQMTENPNFTQIIAAFNELKNNIRIFKKGA